MKDLNFKFNIRYEDGNLKKIDNMVVFNVLTYKIKIMIGCNILIRRFSSFGNSIEYRTMIVR